jgi:spermidine synthase
LVPVVNDGTICLTVLEAEETVMAGTTLSTRNRNILLAAFALSGGAGLIYELLWTQYLRLFLGHAAYAQALVIALFMGGMAIGAWLCGSYSARLQRPLALYALAEGATGLYGLLFHVAYTKGVHLSELLLVPALRTPSAVMAGKWFCASLLILPPSILIGMTFPLMSAGVLRLSPLASGRLIALLYAANSLGAVIGVLCCGFVLIGHLGLPGSMAIAGCMSLAAALIAAGIDRACHFSAQRLSEMPPALASPRPFFTFMAVAFATGFASFLYEIGWIRLLNLVLGSSVHTFELVLSAFILGLALGSLLISRHADTLSNPRATLALVQLAMGSLAVATLPLYSRTYDVVARLVTLLPKSDAGYLLYNLSSSGIAMAVVIPATICAGMTLPLITRLLMGDGFGEKSIGAVYAANTLGGIFGTFLAIHAGFELVGVKGVIVAGAAVDIGAGLFLLRRGMVRNWSLPVRGAVLVLPLLAVAGGAFYSLDPARTTSGVYRSGGLLDPSGTYRVLFNRDGKTATISVVGDEQGVSFRTNGKSDAGFGRDFNAAGVTDEPTMVLLAALPMALHPGARVAANIGLGSGMTTHTLLTNPEIERVDTVEIERQMVEAARAFGPGWSRVFRDPRSSIHQEDARTFFAGAKGKYDIIISEPSNPWVSGVAGLFSAEFYRSVKKSLAPDGIYAQWLHFYEIDEELVVSILKAMTPEFKHFAIYCTQDLDVLLVARNTPLPATADGTIFSRPELARELARVGVTSTRDLFLRLLATRGMLAGLLDTYPVRANSDFFPILEQRAPRSFFLKRDAGRFTDVGVLPLPIAEMLGGGVVPGEHTDITPAPGFTRAERGVAAMELRDFFLTPGKGGAPLDPELKWMAEQVLALFHPGHTADPTAPEAMRRLFKQLIPYLSPAEMARICAVLERGGGVGALSPQDREWFALFRGVGARAPLPMIRHATNLLRNPDAVPEKEDRKFLVASAMLGLIASGDQAGAREFWNRYGHLATTGQEPGLLFKMLLAYREG